MDLDVTFLSRLQFALTIMFHYLFPPLTIGMGVVIVYLEGMYLRTRDPLYASAARFWTSLFAISFAVGVASGIVMEFQFGTNWAAYSRFVGDVFGSALAAEGIFAFFLESGFLAVLVFGWDKVSAGFHFFAALMVSLGSMFSAVWIIVANSWQQTPAGHRVVQVMRDGEPWFINGAPVMRAVVDDFWAVVLNPSTLNRLSHTLIGAFILGSFFIMSISAWYLLKGKHVEFAKRSFSGALVLATLASLAELVSGDLNSRMVARYQPAKLAAFEGHFVTGPAGLSLFGLPDPAERRTKFTLSIPGGLSLLVHRDAQASVIGLDKIPEKDWPPVAISYFSFHLMVGLGIFFIALTLYAAYLHRRGALFEKRWLMWVFVVAVIGPFAANQLGWIAAEVGRQPWTVQPNVLRDAAGNVMFDSAGMVMFNLAEGLRTADAVSANVTGGKVLGSILMFGFVYGLLFLLWLYVLNSKIQKGPLPVDMPQRTTGRGILQSGSARTMHDNSLSEAKDRPEPAGE